MSQKSFSESEFEEKPTKSSYEFDITIEKGVLKLVSYFILYYNFFSKQKLFKI